MALALIMLSTLQALEPATFLPEAGREVVVAAKAQDGAPLPGLALTLTREGKDPRRLGSTGADGTLQFVPDAAGRCELRARLVAEPGVPPVELVTVLEVQPATNRRRYLLVTVPAGGLLLVLALRRRRSHLRQADAP